MKLYSIADWEKFYENNRTRELKVMSWVPVTNKLDGDGYTELISHHNGAALYGAWIACVHVASKCDPRGTLLRSSRTPHDSASLSRITRIPEPTIEAMLAVTEQIGWMSAMETDLQSKNGTSQEGAGIPQEGATVPRLARARGQEGKGIEGNRKEVPPIPPGGEAERIYDAYPRKEGRGKAIEAIRRALRKASFETLFEATTAYRDAHQYWPISERQYIPHPTTWFNQERWTDDRALWGKRSNGNQPQSAADRKANSGTYALREDEMPEVIDPMIL